MKVTQENGKIVIEFEEERSVDRIIRTLKTQEEAYRVAAEAERKLGYAASAGVEEIRADTIDRLIRTIERDLYTMKTV